MLKRFYGWLKNVVMSFLDNNCSTHAAGLTYFSLLAVVPVLCCVLVAAKCCRVDSYARQQINAYIDGMIVQIEEGQRDSLIDELPGFSDDEKDRKREAAAEFAHKAREISNGLFERIENFDVGTLGWIGFGFLLWTAISSLASVESSFNLIFGVPKPRPIWKRAYMYLGIMIAMPVLATVVLSLPILNGVHKLINATLGATWVTKWVGDGLLWFLDCSLFRILTTLVFATLFFALFYWVVPNCRVRFRAAIGGGLITAVAFGLWVKLCTTAQVGIAKASALYGSFAFLPILLAWLYMSWQIILIGAIIVHSFEAPRAKENP